MFPFFWAPGSDGWTAANKLGWHWAPFILPKGGPRRRVWVFVGLPSCFLSSGSWVGWVGRRKEAGLALGSFHISFLGSWVGWVVCGPPAGLPACFLLSGLLGRMGGPRPTSWARIGLPSYCLSGLLGRMGGPRRRVWVFVGLPSCSFFLGLGSDGWAAAKKLGSWAPIRLPSYFSNCTVGFSLQKKVVRRWLDGWGAPATGLGSHWAPFMFLGSWRVPFPGSDGWAAATGWALPLRSLHQWAPFMFPFWAPFLFPLGSLHVSFLGSAAAPFINGLPSCFLFGLLSCLGMGGRRSHWAPFMFPFWSAGSFGLPSCFVFGLPSCSISGSDGWAAATGLGLHWAPFPSGSLSGLTKSDGWSWVGWVGRGDGVGSLHVSPTA